jgi:hypothetical protein
LKFGMLCIGFAAAVSELWRCPVHQWLLSSGSSHGGCSVKVG